MRNTTLRRIDHLIEKMASIRNSINENYTVDFDVEKILPVVETAVEALADEVDSELKDYGR